MPQRILDLSRQVSAIATSRVEEIHKITRMTKILGINAAIEAARSGNSGFGVVAQQVGAVAGSVDRLAQTLHNELAEKTNQMEELGQALIANIRGSRFADLALNMIDIIDRNLYERSCDVRWWATDAAVVDCAAGSSPEACAVASSRLGVILDSYTVYLDLWVASADGTVIANGRPDRYSVQGKNVAREEWFVKALQTPSGADFVACDIEKSKDLGNSVATYSTAVRKGGEVNGKIVGALGIFFDWEQQSKLVLDSVHLPEEERATTECMILNSSHEVIASRSRDTLFKPFPLKTERRERGFYTDPQGRLIGFALTPGYETYEGLGWYGVLSQTGGQVQKRNVREAELVGAR